MRSGARGTEGSGLNRCVAAGIGAVLTTRPPSVSLAVRASQPDTAVMAEA